MQHNSGHQTLVQIRPSPLRRLKRARGREYWRCLEEYAGTEEFGEFVKREFPAHAEEWNDPVSRRSFLKLMGASLALAGLTGCSYQPPEAIVPYVSQPEGLVPGKPLFYATAMPRGGVGTGLLVEQTMGRPIKVEGNPEHPASLGATDTFAQASLLTIYDPDRSQTINNRGEVRPYTSFLAEVLTAVEARRARQGAGLRILTETVTSPTLANQLEELLRQFPAVRWHQYEPAGLDGARAGARLAFGRYVNTVYDFSRAERILSVDSDFLQCGPGSLRYARQFAARRRVEPGFAGGAMNRLYAVESTPSNTGAKADHRLVLRPSEIEPLTRALAAAVGAHAGTAPALAPGVSEWVAALARDLSEHRGSSLVVAGDYAPAAVHALAHAMNHALGNVGSTVLYTEPVEASPVDQMASLRELVQDMEEGQVEALFILGGNPVYTAPADLSFAARLAKVPFSVHLSLYQDETSEWCHWHIPEAHYLESWGDTRAFDGTATIIQPLIEPLYGGKTAYELLAALTGRPQQSSYDLVREFWMRRFGAGDFERVWRRALHDGVVPDTALTPQEFTLRPEWASAAPSQTPSEAEGLALSAPAPESGDSLEVVFRPDPTVYDGSFSNNAWLQELPKPLTHLTWDNVAFVSPATAARLSVGQETGWKGGNLFTELAELRYKGRAVNAPVWVMPGQPDDCVTVFLGYGRTRAGRVGTGAGYNAYSIRTSDAPWFGAGLEVLPTGRQYELAATQLHHMMEGRDIVRASTYQQYVQNPHLPREDVKEPPDDLSMYPEYEYPGYAWGMAIDVSTCVGCSACVVACQAENNIPVVGKQEVIRSREMHWLRVDSYYTGDPSNPDGTYFMPVPCMHCEKAPCEPVCPVHATVHSAEGLNDMVYNRCVGTRYCSNNCPYKVRRFNFLLYHDAWETPSLKLLMNPEVTVRSRGVMEKCTYCVQRIQHAKIESEKEGRPVRDGEILTACQAACPTESIVFGDINDPTSRVAKLKASPRNYGLLAELNTRPRTTYLSALRNPNREIVDG